MKEKWFEKQNRKEEEAWVKKMKTRVNKEDGKNNDRKNDKRFWNWFLKQSKIKLMATNY